MLSRHRHQLGSGALFFDDLLVRLRLLPSQLESALSELAGQGLTACDGFAGLRALRPRRDGPGRTRQVRAAQMAAAGCWYLTGTVPRGSGRVLYLDGVPIASQSGREVHMSEALDRSAAWEARKALLRRGVGATRLSVAADGMTTP